MRSEYGEYSDRMRENMDQENSEYGHFSRSLFLCFVSFFHRIFQQISIDFSKILNIIKLIEFKYVNSLDCINCTLLITLLIFQNYKIGPDKHFVKSVHIRSYSGPYSFQMWENAEQNNSEYGHFSRSENYFVFSEHTLISPCTMRFNAVKIFIRGIFSIIRCPDACKLKVLQNQKNLQPSRFSQLISIITVTSIP